MKRPAYALPNVPDETVEAILRPVLDAAEALRSPHSIVTARDALNRLRFAMYETDAQLTAADLEAARNHVAEMRKELA